MINSTRTPFHRLLNTWPAARRARRAVESAVGVRFLRRPPLGIEVLADVQRSLPRFECATVFDVGANLGQTAVGFTDWHPGAHVHCFEPGAENFRRLSDRTATLSSVRCYKMALGASPGTAELALASLHSMHRLGEKAAGQASESVEVDTVDRVCAREGIPRVSYLKIDTEGHDLDVLRGAQDSLHGQRVDLVEVEAGMNPSNERHVPLEVLKDYLRGFEYHLFGIYEQRHEWPTGRAILRRCNALFISPRVVADNLRPSAPAP